MAWQMYKIKKASRGKRFDILIEKVERNGVGGATITDRFMQNRGKFTSISLRFSIPFALRVKLTYEESGANLDSSNSGIGTRRKTSERAENSNSRDSGK